MKNKLKKVCYLIMHYFGLLIMAYAICGWLYWHFSVNNFNANPTKELFGGLALLSKAGVKYMLTNMVYLLTGGIGYSLYKINNDKNSIDL